MRKYLKVIGIISLVCYGILFIVHIVVGSAILKYGDAGTVILFISELLVYGLIGPSEGILFIVVSVNIQQIDNICDKLEKDKDKGKDNNELLRIKNIEVDSYSFEEKFLIINNIYKINVNEINFIQKINNKLSIINNKRIIVLEKLTNDNRDEIYDFCIDDKNLNKIENL